MRTPPVPRLVLYALAITVGLTLVVAASTTTAAFGAYNLEWDGTSDLREHADEQAVSNITLDTTAYETASANETVAVVIAPEERYTGNDSQRVQRFVEAGGTLVVADDFGPHGNALLADIGADARFNGSPIRDERHYYRSPSLPIATNVANATYTEAVQQLTLNYPTAIDANSATEIATTSEFAYLDRNETGNLSLTDELGTYPVVTAESVGDGRVIAVGDPSVFINVMLTQPDNEAFATGLLSERERVLLDYSRSGDQPPLAVASLALRSSPPLQIGAGVLGVVAVWAYLGRSRTLGATARAGLFAVLPRGRERLPVWLVGASGDETDGVVDEAAVLSSLKRRYPELDEARLRSMMTDTLTKQSREETNE
ncbi:DUF4350 domain-containing protein [Halorubrum lipolyticum]|uniref:DUF4350 domain-containing protein n=1 Tax=Halorubrum lipolyticum DSM 21995 TaxID=1227482 RepID=M0NKQ1_9EURY|nr:DUF4350 domain-containing protein [Halorubrum lipolyticum]EMA58401.1 hypothetical protein C469_13200 [Halorubrum lipolyticum DSM 21995]